jgi:hypothetical protein
MGAKKKTRLNLLVYYSIVSFSISSSLMAQCENLPEEPARDLNSGLPYGQAVALTTELSAVSLSWAGSILSEFDDEWS